LLRVRVAEHSMLPTLRDGDWLIAWRTRRIRSGQVILAWMPPPGGHPPRPALLLVKRAARRAGGGWWLESDFPEAPGAVDSSGFGPVPDELIVGRVLARYWPKFKSKFLSQVTVCTFPLPSHQDPRGIPLAGTAPSPPGCPVARRTRPCPAGASQVPRPSW
jgi:hypothetical protein